MMISIIESLSCMKGLGMGISRPLAWSRQAEEKDLLRDGQGGRMMC